MLYRFYWSSFLRNSMPTPIPAFSIRPLAGCLRRSSTSKSISPFSMIDIRTVCCFPPAGKTTMNDGGDGIGEILIDTAGGDTPFNKSSRLISFSTSLLFENHDFSSLLNFCH